ncbi:type II toxin-antitoxin system Phd/YefM family antitoxin [Thiorhodovibrio litoralis]|uniref:type II toxin-antitoxin system Phd/YefM family antitoxin n=1 Tax=Thiorhodovibrio litoralis TaxID=2952932 RepID=UPI002B25869C|nr:type II toxin-antitoxin system prevent-host-death family antitoxin [Thiorhodovibrio litoralis]WPL14134.1 Antitoxin YafN [Thiorhodovibrio litoralis]
MSHLVLSRVAASISELKRNPMEILAAGEVEPVAILNRNKPAFYCVPADVFEALLEKLEDLELNATADARASQKEIVISLDEL